MNFWIILFVLMIVLSVISVLYLVSRFHRFTFMQKLGEKHKVLSWVLSLAPVAVSALFYIVNMWAVIVVLIHLLMIWILFDLIFLVLRKVLKKQRKRNYEGACAMAVTAVVLAVGWYNAHHVIQTDYTLSTQKNIGGDRLRVVEIADSHLGITLDGDKFADEMEKLNSLGADVAVIAGDFVDDDSKKADMVRACQALGNLNTKYGVYFVYGNHDNGYYQYRDFTSQELESELEKNGVTVLKDRNVLVGDRFYISGRLDRSFENRKTAQELIQGLDGEKYIIMLDHQPNDYQNETESGADLVLSGHTHGGHIFPAGYVGLWLKMNDRVYGHERRNSTDFIVTSGISGWAIPFKTGTVSETVVIDVYNS